MRTSSPPLLRPFAMAALMSTLLGCSLEAGTEISVEASADADASADAEVEATDTAEQPSTTGCSSDGECSAELGALPNCRVAKCDMLTGQCMSAEAPGGTTCDDDNICTTGDICLAGECLPGASQTCEDNNPCTDDLCDPVSGCANTFNEDTCDDGNACTANDACVEGTCISGTDTVCDDTNPCTDDTCDPLSGCVFTPAPGAACNDSDACTVGDQCSAAGVCLSQTTLECFDDNPCTNDSCSTSQGCVFEPNAELCDDGQICTLNDICLAGICTGQQDSCDDADSCTVDSCVPGEGCQHLAHDGPCDDNDLCTFNDVCVDGECLGTDNDCDDGNLCTQNFCHPFNGCQTTPLLGTQCDDLDACTVLDSCDASGFCVSGMPEDCDDGKSCTADSCDPLIGCVNQPLDVACDDGDACTTGDVCIDDTCVGSLITCDDANLCTTDTCSQSEGCLFTPNDAPCDDGDPCSLNDVCEAGSCVGLTGSCDDGNECTLDTCDADAACHHEVITGPCDDQNACTVGDSCIDAACVPGPEVACEDNDPCTIDLCDVETGCSHTTVPSCLPPSAWPIINEFDYEQHGTDSGDFVELVVVGEQTVELDSYTLELVDGTTGQPYDAIELSEGAEQLHPGERLVVGPSAIIVTLVGKVATVVVEGDFLQNGGVDGDGIRLVRSTAAGDVVVDSVAYEHAVPGANEGDSHVGFDSEFGINATSFSRCADSQDTQMNSFDFVLGEPSPGEENPCVEPETE